MLFEEKYHNKQKFTPHFLKLKFCRECFDNTQKTKSFLELNPRAYMTNNRLYRVQICIKFVSIIYNKVNNVRKL